MKFRQVNNPFEVKWQDKFENMKQFEWNIQELYASLYIDDEFLLKAREERSWIFKTNIKTYFIDSVSNWNEYN